MSLNRARNSKESDLSGKAYQREKKIIKSWVGKNMELILISFQQEFIFKKLAIIKRLIQMVKDQKLIVRWRISID